MFLQTLNKHSFFVSVLILFSSLLPAAQSRDCSIIYVHGSNGKTGAGFGVLNDGSVPRTGSAGDAGADATQFTLGANPNPACGKVAEIQGNTVDIGIETQKAITDGLPSVYPNGSIPLTVFQVNRNGGGPMTCEYSADATGNSWQPMDVTLNMPGNFGLQDADRVQYMVVATFKAGSRVTGGDAQNMGLVRCRAGQSGVCGGCFAVQLDGQVVRAGTGSDSTPAVSTPAPALSLTSQQMSALLSKVIDVAKDHNLVAPASTA